MNNIHVGDIGVNFFATILDENSNVIDLSSATSMYFNFKRPNNTSFSVIPSFYSDGTDGNLVYSTVSGDISLAGLYSLQVAVTTPAQSFSTDISTFRVERNI